MNELTRSIRRFATRSFLAATCLFLAACDDLPTLGSGPSPKINGNDAVIVALLVPSGSGQASDDLLAASLENAARLAISELQGAVIDLRVYQTAGSASRAGIVANQAANDGAKIILGPVYAAAANAAGAAVADRGINVLSFSNNSDVAGGNVFVLGNTFENTANRLVSYAVSQGKRKILVVNGQDVAEEKGRTAINGALARFGATSAGNSSFELSQNGISAAVPGIRNAINTNGAQAVFLTSGTAGALPILSQMMVDNGVNPANTQFIGLQRWDIPVQALDLPSLQGGWFAIPSPGLATQFNARYAAANDGKQPHAIAGLGYDGIAAIGALIKTGKPDAFSAASLTQNSGFRGVGGIFRLRSDGTNERGLAIATISNKQVKVIDAAPTSFGGAGS